MTSATSRVCRSSIAIALAAVLTSPALACVECILDLEGIKGEAASADNSHKAQIEVLAFSWGTRKAEQTLRGPMVEPHKVPDVTLKRGLTDGAGTAGGSSSGLPTGKRQHKPLTITKPVDRASGSLTVVIPAGVCTLGARYPKAKLSTGEAVYRMDDVVVTGCSKASGGDRPSEQISLNYSKVVVRGWDPAKK